MLELTLKEEEFKCTVRFVYIWPIQFCTNIVLFAGDNSKARELPGAALFCLTLTPKDVNIDGATKVR